MIIYKGKGILIPIFFVVSVMGIAIMAGIIERNLDSDLINQVSFSVIFGLGIIVSGLWTWFAGREFIKKNGKKVKIDLGDSFFFIKMEVVGYLLMLLGVITVFYGLYDTYINMH